MPGGLAWRGMQRLLTFADITLFTSFCLDGTVSAFTLLYTKYITGSVRSDMPSERACLLLMGKKG